MARMDGAPREGAPPKVVIYLDCSLRMHHGPLAVAETLWKQGDHDGAWLALEELGPIDRVMPQVINLRLGVDKGRADHVIHPRRDAPENPPGQNRGSDREPGRGLGQTDGAQPDQLAWRVPE